MTEIYLEGNSGGDNILIKPLEDGRVHLRVGHCCVYVIDHVVPVEFLTAILATAITNTVEDAMKSINWPSEFIDELCGKIERVPLGGLSCLESLS